MKAKRFCALLCITLLILTLTSCVGAGLQDWSYTQLPGDYEIWRINSQDIVLGKNDGGSLEHTLDRFILEFCYNNTYIGVMQLVIDESVGYDVRVEDMDKSDPAYYLVDSKTDRLMGPFSREEYDAKIEKLGIYDMCDWIKTVPAPKGAT